MLSNGLAVGCMQNGFMQSRSQLKHLNVENKAFLTTETVYCTFLNILFLCTNWIKFLFVLYLYTPVPN